MYITAAQAPAQNLASKQRSNREKKFYLRKNDLFKSWADRQAAKR
jgi:hypothetical protein